MASYNQGDTVEFDPNTYTANNNISGGYPKCKLGSHKIPTQLDTSI